MKTYHAFLVTDGRTLQVIAPDELLSPEQLALEASLVAALFNARYRARHCPNHVWQELSSHAGMSVWDACLECGVTKEAWEAQKLEELL